MAMLAARAVSYSNPAYGGASGVHFAKVLERLAIAGEMKAKTRFPPEGGFTARLADAAIVIPTVNAERVTPHTEAFQAVLWHLLVSHPLVKVAQTKWESTR